MKPYLLFTLVLSVPSASLADIYQWNDTSGVTHLSDSFQPNTKEIKEINVPKPAISTVIPTKTTAISTVITPSHSAIVVKAPDIYKKILIKQPQEQETLQYNEGKVSITLSIEPALKDNAKIAIYLDSNKIMETKKLSFTVGNIERGEHNLQVKIIYENGAVLLTSPATTFYMHQTSILNQL